MMKTLCTFSCGTIVALIAFVAAPLQAAHVDFFDAAPFTLTADEGQTQADTQTAPNADILGGERRVTLISTAGGTSGAVSASLVVDSPDVVNNAVVVNFAGEGSAEFYYGGGLPNEALNADFLNIPNSGLDWTHIEVDFDAGTIGGGTAMVTLFSGAGGGTAATLTQLIPTGNNDLMFFYSDFLAQAPGLVLTDIDAARLLITADAGQNYVVSFFGRAGAIPTPAALPAGLALLSAIALLRRHRPRFTRPS